MSADASTKSAQTISPANFVSAIQTVAKDSALGRDDAETFTIEGPTTVLLLGATESGKTQWILNIIVEGRIQHLEEYARLVIFATRMTSNPAYKSIEDFMRQKIPNLDVQTFTELTRTKLLTEPTQQETKTIYIIDDFLNVKGAQEIINEFITSGKRSTPSVAFVAIQRYMPKDGMIARQNAGVIVMFPMRNDKQNEKLLLTRLAGEKSLSENLMPRLHMEGVEKPFLVFDNQRPSLKIYDSYLAVVE